MRLLCRNNLVNVLIPLIGAGRNDFVNALSCFSGQEFHMSAGSAFFDLDSHLPAGIFLQQVDLGVAEMGRHKQCTGLQ